MQNGGLVQVGERDQVIHRGSRALRSLVVSQLHVVSLSRARHA
jgi:hypothetical protein